MKTTLQVDSKTRPPQPTAKRAPATDYAYQPNRHASLQTGAAAAKKTPEFTTLRALGRQVLGVQARREYIKEAILFGGMMVVAAWPLSVTLNQLGTMMISPPPWVG